MTVNLHVTPWETVLIDRAYAALSQHVPTPRLEADGLLLEAAYWKCDQITRDNSRTFYMASALLPRDKRRAARALYAFCRVTDDLVDRAPSEAREAALTRWRGAVLAPTPPPGDAVALAWADARARYNIPLAYAEQLIDGVARDLVKTRYETFSDLADYAYGVASTVGLMAMHIIGFCADDAVPYAVKLGVALQLTNILRDVAEDWRMGRLYLPAEELEDFGLTQLAIAEGVCDARWQRFMDYQVERTHKLYEEAWPGIAMLTADGRFAIATAAELYRAILGDIQRHSGDVFTRRAHVSTVSKLLRLPGIWQRAYAPAPGRSQREAR